MRTVRFSYVLLWLSVLQCAGDKDISAIVEDVTATWSSARDHVNGVPTTLPDLLIPLSDSALVTEPRNHCVKKLIIVFSHQIDEATWVPSAVSVVGRDQTNTTIDSSSMPSVTSMTYDSATKTGTIVFDNAVHFTDIARYRVTVSGVETARYTPIIGAATRQFACLLGDSGGDGQVKTSGAEDDDDLVLNRFGAGMTSSSSLSDIRLDSSLEGDINLADLSFVSASNNHSILTISAP